MNGTRPVACALPGIILAGGLSRRMGTSKLTLPLNGRPLLAYALEAGLGGGLDPLIVVRGPHSPDFSSLLSDRQTDALRAEVLTAQDAAMGQAHSLKAGLFRVLEISPEAPGVMILLGDQPLIRAELVRALVNFFFREASIRPVCAAPAHAGKRGHPVVLHAQLFPMVKRLEGDTGARELLASLPLRLLSWPDDSCLADVDVPSALAEINARMQDNS